MSKVIDNKVVEMSFDNRNFETNVKTSLGTLDKLKKSLNFDDATKGFENLDKASKKLSFDSIGDGIEEVKAKFSALDIVAFTALQNITNKVVETGRQMVRSLTIDPVKSGWDKFAEKTQAVQTIMSATVTTWEDEAAAMGGYDSQMDFVNDQIEKLNWYADETSYSLTDMVSNVGKFTAAGQGLGTSVEALMGISNWGARSGSEINQLSRAYYNLSQALGKGMLSLQDWMSIENANMATYEFKEQLIQAGLAMGKLKEAADAPPGTYEIIGAQNEFFVNPENLRETLKEGWVTSDVMMYVYREYGKASKLLSEISERASDTFTTTGFLNDLEELQEAGSKISVKDIADRYGIEDVEQLAKDIETLTSEEYALSLASFKAGQEAITFKQAMDATADAVSTQWMKTFELIFGNFEEAKEFWSDITELLWDMFAASGVTRNAILSLWKEAGGSDALKEAFWNIVETIEAIITPIKEAYYSIFYGVDEAYAGLNAKIEASANRLVKFTSALKEVTGKIKDFFEEERNAEALKTLFFGIFAVLNTIKKIIGAVAKGFKALFEPLNGFKSAKTDVMGALESIGNFLKKIADAAEEAKIFENITNGIANAINRVKYAFTAFDGVVDDFRSIFNRVKQYIENGLGNPVKNVIAGVIDAIESLVHHFVRFLELLTGSDLSDFQNDVTKAFNNINKVFMDFIDACRELPEQVNAAFKELTGKSLTEIFEDIKKSVTDAWESVKEFFEGFKDLDYTSFDDFKKKIEDTMNPLAPLFTALGWAFSFFISILKELGKVLGWVADGVKQAFGGVIDQLKKEDGSFDTDSLMGLLAGGTLVAILMGIKKIVDLIKNPLEELHGGVVDILDEVRECFQQWQENLKAKVIKDIGIGIALVVASCLLLCMIPAENLMQSLMAIAFAVGVMKSLISSFNKIKEIEKLAAIIPAVVALGATMLMLATAIGILALVPGDKMLVAVLSIGILFKMIVQVLKSLAGSESGIQGLKGDTPKVAAAIIGIAFAIQILANAIAVLSLLKLGGLVQGVAAIGILLYLITTILKDIDKNSYLDEAAMLAMAGAILIIANAMVIMAGAIAILGALNPAKMAVGLAAVLILIFTISVILARFSEGGMKQTGALLAAGAAFILIAVAMDILCLAIVAIGQLDWKQMLIGVAAVLAIVIAIAAALVIMADVSGPMILAAAAALLIAAYAISQIVVTLVAGVLAFSAMDPKKLVQGLLGLIGAFAALALAGTLLTPAIPAFVGLGIALALIGAAVFLAGTGIAKLATGIALLVGLGSKGLALFVESIDVMIKKIPDLAKALGQGFTAFFVGILEGKEELINAIVDIILVIVEALKKVLPALKDFFISIIPDLADTLLVMIVEILDRLSQRVDEIVYELVMIVGGILEGLIRAFPDFIERIGQAIIDGCYKLGDVMVEQAPEMRKAIIYLAKSMMTALLEFFGVERGQATEMTNTAFTLIKSFIHGIVEKVAEVIKAIVDLCTKIVNKITEWTTKFKDKGTEIINNIKEGVSSGIESVKTKIQEMLNGIKQKIEAFFTPLKNIGEYLISGFIQGFAGSKALQDVEQSATNVTNVVANTARRNLGVNSPSKVFRQIGRFVDEGLILGLRDYTSRVEDASSDVGTSVLNAMQETLDTLSDSMNDELISSPVITPVLDLSEIQNGSGMINDLFGYQRMNLAFASDGFNSNRAIDVNAENNDFMRATMTEIFSRFVPEIITAINTSSANQKFTFDLTPNTRRFYKEMRIENSRFERANGYNGMV